MRDSANIVVLQRKIRESIARIKEFDPDCELISSYTSLNEATRRCIREIREDFEWAVHHPDLTDSQRKDACRGLHLALLVESEFALEAETAH